MKVILKKPGAEPEIIEAEDVSEINKLVGNIDENGNGYNYTSSDLRMFIGENIDMYVKEDALFNFGLKKNMWAPDNNGVYYGNIVFAGFSQDSDANFGVCSLTDEQIKYCLEYIAEQTV